MLNRKNKKKESDKTKAESVDTLLGNGEDAEACKVCVGVEEPQEQELPGVEEYPVEKHPVVPEGKGTHKPFSEPGKVEPAGEVSVPEPLDTEEDSVRDLTSDNIKELEENGVVVIDEGRVKAQEKKEKELDEADGMELYKVTGTYRVKISKNKKKKVVEFEIVDKRPKIKNNVEILEDVVKLFTADVPGFVELRTVEIKHIS